MDTLTHGLLAAVTTQLGFRQRIGRDATWVAFAAAMVPDLDSFVSPLLSVVGVEQTSFDGLVIHRSLSHSLLVLPFLALPIALLWGRIKRSRAKKKGAGRIRPPSFLLLYTCVLLALLTQPFLDVCTSYGTQIFAPITSTRYAIDAMPIIDFIFTPILIFTLLACYIVRKVKADSRRATLRIGWVGFALSILYIAAGFAIHNLVIHQMKVNFEKSGDGRETQAVRAQYDAYPQLGTIFVWRATRRTRDTWLALRVNVLFGIDVENAAKNEAPVQNNEWIERARELPDAKTFDWFAMGRTRAVYFRREGRHVVEFHDMRYGIRPESLEGLWAARVTFDESGDAPSVERAWGIRRNGIVEMLRHIWQDIVSP